MRTVLFICTGNTCRSPMAEGIARHLLESGAVEGVGSGLFVASAGVFASDGIPISPESADALARRGIEADIRSTRLTPEMVRKADLVLGMTASHVEAARMMAGEDSGTPIERVDPQVVGIAIPRELQPSLFDEKSGPLPFAHPGARAPLRQATPGAASPPNPYGNKT